VRVLGDSHNGYFSKLQVYTGAVDSLEKGLGSRVVKELTARLHRKYHHTYFDNFTSQQLLVDLEKDGVYGCGTARKDRRGFPEMLKSVKLTFRFVYDNMHICRCAMISCSCVCVP